MTGRVWGVGVGPGDPELLTVKAARLIREADVICYPQPDTGPSFARSIVGDMPNGALEEPIVVPMRSERFPAAAVYDDAARRVRDHVEAGRTVVVLCEGDPFFYGSFMYLYARLADHARVGVVPGVSSAMAGAAVAGVPLAARDDVLTVLPGTLDDTELERALQASDAAVIIKVGRHLPRIRALLERVGLLDRTRYCERIGTTRERVGMLADRPEDNAPYFSLLLVYKGGEPWITELPRPDEGAFDD